MRVEGWMLNVARHCAKLLGIDTRSKCYDVPEKRFVRVARALGKCDMHNSPVSW